MIPDLPNASSDIIGSKRWRDNRQRGEEGKEHKDNLSFDRYIRTTFPRANLGDGEGKKERKKEGRKKERATRGGGQEQVESVGGAHTRGTCSFTLRRSVGSPW